MNISQPHVWYDKSHIHHCGDDMHPENPERVKAIVRRLKGNLSDSIIWHAYNDSIQDITEEDNEMAGENDRVKHEWHTTDGDTYYTAYTHIICNRGILMIAEAIENITYHGLRCGFVFVRPPGHHVGMTTGAQGFCHLNSVWIAVEEFNKRRVRKIGILDWDVHHGDGTENCVRENAKRIPGIRFVSLHAYGTGIYPGTGANSKDEHVLNVALPVGTKGPAYMTALQTQAIPFLGTPDVLIVSAGYDGHFRDPMQYMKLRSDTYRHMSEAVKGIGCPVLFVLEGGYCPEAVAESIEETLKVWI
jgi:acetoin utilization deacetylase AcuC-like enzyme